MKELPPNGVCPFCGGELHTDDSDDESYMAAINAEIRRIASELTVIAATEKSVAYDTIRRQSLSAYRNFRSDSLRLMEHSMRRTGS